LDTIIVKCIPISNETKNLSEKKNSSNHQPDQHAIRIEDRIQIVDPALFDQAVLSIRQGQLVAFPTETVYGLGANALDPCAVRKIFEAKGRPSDNPLIVHVAKEEQILPLVKTITPLAKKMIDAFMPGPITLVFEKSGEIPYEVTAGLDTVAIRIPSHPIAHLFLERAHIPVAAPSANVSGKPSTTTAKHVYDDLKGRIPYIIDGGASDYGVESTVVNVTGEIPVILRPGAITAEQIFGVCGSVSGIGSAMQQIGSYETALNQNTRGTPMSPGMKYKHYAPKARVVLTDAPTLSQRIQIMRELLQKGISEGKKIGVFGCEEMITAAKDAILPVKDSIAVERLHTHSYGLSGDIKAASSRLFFALREMDEAGVDIVIAEALPIKGIGVAYMNRLLKSAGISSKEKE